MNRKNLVLFLFTGCLAAAFAFADFRALEAQTSGAGRTRQVVSPTPTVTRQIVSPTPTAAPPAIKTPVPVTAATLPADDDIIKIDTEIVNLNVRVIDRNNRPITNLKQADFKIFEDNVPQVIQSLSTAEVPTNYSLVIDNSGSLRQQLDQVIEASKILVATNRPDDDTSLIRFTSSDKIEIVQDFTSKKEDLNDALDNLYIDGGQTAIIDAVYLAAERVTDYEKEQGDDRKRRALILVSDGEDRNSFYNEKQLFDRLRESNVQIFTIGFVGDLSKEGGFISKSPQSKAKSLMERLATETGGKSYFPSSISELNGIAQNIASEMRTQYSISYTPTSDRQAGAVRNIKVQVADGPDKQKRIAITRNSIAGKPGSAPAIRKTQ